MTWLKAGWRGPLPLSTFSSVAPGLGLRDPVVFEADGNRAPHEEMWKWPAFDVDVHVVSDHLAGCGYLVFKGARAGDAAAALAADAPLWFLDQVLAACRVPSTMAQALPFLGVLPESYSDDVMHALADALLANDEAIETAALTAIALLGFQELAPLVVAASTSSSFAMVRARAADVLHALRVVASGEQHAAPAFRLGWPGPQPVSALIALAPGWGFEHQRQLRNSDDGVHDVWFWPAFAVDVHFVDDATRGCAFLEFVGAQATEAASCLAGNLPLWSVAHALQQARVPATMAVAVSLLGVLATRERDDVIEVFADAIVVQSDEVQARAILAMHALRWPALRPLVFAAAMTSSSPQVRTLAREVLDAFAP